MDVSQRKAWNKILAVSCLIFIGAVGLRPKPIEQYVENFDKYIHTLGFFALTSIFLYAYGRNHWLSAALFLSGFGLFIELYQGWFLPLRSFDVGDLGTDILGISLAILVVSLLPRRVVRRLGMS